MKYRKPFTLSLVALAIVGVFAVPALAKDGADDTTTSGDSSRTHTSSGDGSSSNTAPTTKSEDKSRTTIVNSRLQQEAELKNRTNAQSIVQEMKDKNEQKTSDSKKRQNCDTEKGGIKTKTATLGTNASRYLEKLDAALQRAEAYQQTKHLTVADWDMLVATATTAQTNATASVAALKALNVTIDCTQPSVATQVATIKAAATQARTDLKAYKQAVIAVLKTLENTKEQGEQ
jgi:hypothetical protein